LESANTTQPHVSILKAATTPSQPKSHLLLYLSLAVLLGLLLGIARALLAESRDRRLRTVEDVTGWLRQPLLLALPDGHARSRVGARRSAETQQRLVSVHRPGLLPR
jgi:capsular polysaccharide biosynthesis protein